MDLRTIVLQFNDAINRRDINGLERLMTEDHIFIDTENNKVKGKQACLASWAGFFKMFPDYKNIFETTTVKDDLVIVVGDSVCSYKLLEGPAIWTAKIRDNKITEWRVYEDTPINRQQLAIE